MHVFGYVCRCASIVREMDRINKRSICNIVLSRCFSKKKRRKYRRKRKQRKSQGNVACSSAYDSSVKNDRKLSIRQDTCPLCFTTPFETKRLLYCIEHKKLRYFFLECYVQLYFRERKRFFNFDSHLGFERYKNAALFPH